MSFNIPLINTTEDKIQDDIGNLQTDKQKASESHSENPLSKDKDKDMEHNKVPALDKYGSAYKTETKHTLKLDNKKRSLPLASSDDKNMEEQEPTNMTIKNNKSAHDDQSCSNITESLDGGRIPKKKVKKKLSKNSITWNKINQDQDNINK